MASLGLAVLTLCMLVTSPRASGCGAYFASPQFGWSSYTFDERLPRTRTENVAIYISQLLQDANPSDASTSLASPAPVDEPLNIQAVALVRCLDGGRTTISRITADLQLALIESLGRDQPRLVRLLLAGATIDRTAFDLTHQQQALLDAYRLATEAWGLYLDGRHEQAARAAESALDDAQDTSFEPALRYILARARSRLEPARECEHMQRVVDHDPKGRWVHSAKGWIAHGHLHHARFDKALELYVALSTDPAAAHMHGSSRGSIAITLRKADQAGDASIMPVVMSRPWLAAAGVYRQTLSDDHWIDWTSQRDDARSRLREMAEEIRRTYHVQPPYLVTQEMAHAAYESGAYDETLSLIAAVPERWRLNASKRLVGHCIAAKAALSETVTLDLAEALIRMHDLDGDARNWLYGEIGRKLLERKRPVEAAIAFNRGGFRVEVEFMLDLALDSDALQQLPRKDPQGGWSSRIARSLIRQLAREGQFERAAALAEKNDSPLASPLRELSDHLKQWEHSPSPERALAIGDAFGGLRFGLRNNRYLSWRGRHLRHAVDLGLLTDSFPKNNPHWSAIQWYDELMERWPDHELVPEALHRSAIAAFWTSDWDAYWLTHERPKSAATAWSLAPNPRWIEEGADRLRRLLRIAPHCPQADDARRRLAWAEEMLDD